MMEAQFVSPTNSMKRKNQIAARRIKNGSPKLQEVFRQVRITALFLIL